MLRHTPARPEQPSLPNTLTAKFPLFEYAGRSAAQLWLAAAPLSMGEWRDLRFRTLVAGTEWMPGDEDRRAAFDAAFCQTIALSIAHQSRIEVRHGR